MMQRSPLRDSSDHSHDAASARSRAPLRLVQDVEVADWNREDPRTAQRLMERVKEGDRDALRELVHLYWNPLIDYIATITSSPDDAEDVVQETFVRIWRYRAQWKATSMVSSYLYRVARNLALNAQRDSKARLGREQSAPQEFLGDASRRTPEQVLSTTTISEDVDAAVASLPKRRQEIFILSRYHGFTHAEIAETLGLSGQTVANHMSVALKDLRSALAEHLQELHGDSRA